MQIPSHEVFAITDERAIAGWLSTIAAIDNMPEDDNAFAKSLEAAWPDDLL
jgi:hypothetical protein